MSTLRGNESYRPSLKICFAVGKEKGFRKNKAACAVNATQAVFLPSGDIVKVAEKYQL